MYKCIHTYLDGEEHAPHGRAEGGGDAHGAGRVQDLPPQGGEAEHLIVVFVSRLLVVFGVEK